MFKQAVFSRSVFPANFALPALALGALLASLCVLPACSVNVKDKGDGDSGKHVDIKSPLGDLHVSKNVDAAASGLTVYPGAKPAPDDDREEEKSANVDLSLPGFALKVVAAEYLSDDSPEKLTAYYDKELQKFGKPIQCHGGWNGHTDSNINKDKLSQPVACDKADSGDSVELKVGTEGNQHIVAVKPHGKGTRFALVYVRVHTGSDNTI